MLTPRPTVIAQINRSLVIQPIVALLGPRQCGKTTVARMIAEQQPATFFDLENPVDVHDLHATMLHQLGLDHTRLTYRYSGRDFRLTDVHGNLIKAIIET